MFYEQARRSYENQETNFVEQIEDQHEIVRLILKELRKHLTIIVSDREIELSEQARHYSKAFTALHLLLSSIDTEKGGEISENLVTLYLYIQQQLIDGRTREEFTGDKNIVNIVADLLEAWENIR
ncbi:MAG: flagellar protein FliS [PS1 clade bacterium]|nr:flagellar protein FliS [PS1 clade bacterium]